MERGAWEVYNLSPENDFSTNVGVPDIQWNRLNGRQISSQHEFAQFFLLDWFLIHMREIRDRLLKTEIYISICKSKNDMAILNFTNYL